MRRQISTATPFLLRERARTKPSVALSLVVIWCALATPARPETTAARNGGEFQVNTFTRATQGMPAVAHTKSGAEFVVFWSGPEPAFDPGTRFGIIGQRFDHRGDLLGREIQANHHPDRVNEDRDPVVAAADDGGFVVVWEDNSADDGWGTGIFGRWFDASGSSRGDEFAVNIFTTGDQLDPRIATLSTGEFAVTWTHAPGNSEVFESEIRGRILTSPGVGSIEFVVAEDTTSAPVSSVLAPAPGGEFVVIWQATADDGTGERIFGRRFASDGGALSPPTAITSPLVGSDFEPDLATDDTGILTVVWTRAAPAGSGIDLNIMGRRLFADLNPLGNEFQVNADATHFHEHPSIAMDANGSFMVVWTSFGSSGSSADSPDGNLRGVFGQLFDSAAVHAGSVFQVNTYTTGDQGGTVRRQLDISAARNGNYIVTWASEPDFRDPGQDGSRGGVFAQRFCVNPPPERSCGNATCVGDPDLGMSPSNITTTDALATLQVAVEARGCEACVCDVNASGSVSASDALIVLQNTLGVGPALTCPPCS